MFIAIWARYKRVSYILVLMLIAVHAVSCSSGTNNKNTTPTQATVSATAAAPDGDSTAPASVTSDSDGSGQKIWTETELLNSTGLRFAIRESSQDDYDAYNALATDAAIYAREKLLDMGIINAGSRVYQRGYEYSATKLAEQRDMLVNALMDTTDGDITFTDDPEQCNIVLRYKVTFVYSGEYGHIDKVRGYGHKYNIQAFNKSTGEFIAETTVSNSAGSIIPAVSTWIYVHRFPILQNYDEFAAFVEFLQRGDK